MEKSYSFLGTTAEIAVFAAVFLIGLRNALAEVWAAGTPKITPRFYAVGATWLFAAWLSSAVAGFAIHTATTTFGGLGP